MRTYKANKVKYFKTEESQTKSINNSKNSFGREREIGKKHRSIECRPKRLTMNGERRMESEEHSVSV